MAAVCLVVAVALQGGALGGAGWALRRETIGGHSAVERPAPMQLAAARAAPPTSQRESVAPPLSPKAVEPAPTPRPTESKVAAPEPRRAPRTSPGPPETSAADGTGDTGYRFYGANEVDVTAEPVSEWTVDPDALDALATSRIVFTLFVGRDGSILRCSVDEPERLTPEQRRALAERLATTAMRPARIAGQPVPSRRRVELFTVGGV